MQRDDCLRIETGYWLGTVQIAYAEILTGIRPWNAIGNFVDDWRSSVTTNEQRWAMVRDPLPDAGPTLELQRWAAFCAAMVEELCSNAGIAVPDWTTHPAYFLTEPWYLYRGKQPEWLAWQEEASPESFRRRKIYGGDSILSRA